jgi:hypothetical protein
MHFETNPVKALSEALSRRLTTSRDSHFQGKSNSEMILEIKRLLPFTGTVVPANYGNDIAADTFINQLVNIINPYDSQNMTQPDLLIISDFFSNFLQYIHLLSQPIQQALHPHIRKVTSRQINDYLGLKNNVILEVPHFVFQTIEILSNEDLKGIAKTFIYKSNNPERTYDESFYSNECEFGMPVRPRPKEYSQVLYDALTYLQDYHDDGDIDSIVKNLCIFMSKKNEKDKMDESLVTACFKQLIKLEPKLTHPQIIIILNTWEMLTNKSIRLSEHVIIRDFLEAIKNHVDFESNPIIFSDKIAYQLNSCCNRSNSEENNVVVINNIVILKNNLSEDFKQFMMARYLGNHNTTSRFYSNSDFVMSYSQMLCSKEIFIRRQLLRSLI